ncbi:MAG: PAS domain S-box protein [Gallionellaceae bacterium]|nr:PAS domain S-box protein [Gallionellaceae bacterium]
MFAYDHRAPAEGGFPSRLFLLLFAPVVLLIVGGAWYLGQERIAAEMALVRAGEIGSVVAAVRRLDGELQAPLRHLRTLADADAPGRGGLEAAFAGLIAHQGHYGRLRRFDAWGRERLHLDNVGGQPVRRAPPERLDDGGILRASHGLGTGEVYVTAMTLARVEGAVVVPHRPELSLATPAAGPDGGLLVLDLAAGWLLDAFVDSLVEARDHTMLLDGDGYWLKSPDSEGEWGFMYGSEDTLARRNPAAWQAIAAAPSGQVELADGLWTWSTVYPFKAADGLAASRVPTWLVAAHLPAAQLAPLRLATWWTVGPYMLAMLALYGGLAAWLARAVAGRARALGVAVRAQAEAEAAHRLRQAQERFRLVVEANTNGLLVADRDGRIVLANPALASMFGYEREELLGQPLGVLLPEPARAGHARMLADFLGHPAVRPMGQGRELNGRRKDGSEFPIEVSLSPFIEDGETYVDAFVADISARKRIERLHRRIEARLQLMMQGSPVGLMVVDDQGAIEMANPALERLFGYGPGELCNLPVARLLPEAGPRGLVRPGYSPAMALRAAADSGHPVGVRKDGGRVNVALALACFEEEGRGYVQVTVTPQAASRASA